MISTFDRRLWIFLLIILIQCIHTAKQQNITPQKSTHLREPADKWNETTKARADGTFVAGPPSATSSLRSAGDNEHAADSRTARFFDSHYEQQTRSVNLEKCAKNNRNSVHCIKSKQRSEGSSLLPSPLSNITTTATPTAVTTSNLTFHALAQLLGYQPSDGRSHKPHKKPSQMPSMSQQLTSRTNTPAKRQRLHQQPQDFAKGTTQRRQNQRQKFHVAHRLQHKDARRPHYSVHTFGRSSATTKRTSGLRSLKLQEAFKLATRPRRDLGRKARSANELDEETDSSEEGEAKEHLKLIYPPSKRGLKSSDAAHQSKLKAPPQPDATATDKDRVANSKEDSSLHFAKSSANATKAQVAPETTPRSASQLSGVDVLILGPQDISDSLEDLQAAQVPQEDQLLLPTSYYNESFLRTTRCNTSSAADPRDEPRPGDVAEKRTRAVQTATPQLSSRTHEPIIIIDDVEEFDSGTDRLANDKSEDYAHDEPRVLPLRPLLPNPYDEGHAEEMSVVYAEQHTEIRLMCEVDLDIATSVWYKNGLVVHAMDRTSRVTDYRFIKEANGGLTITNVMLEDDGKWLCEAENARAYVENARPVRLVVLDRPKPPYLLIDSRRLDAGNIFVPVKENSELNLACISEGGNPKPTLTWEVLLSPGVDRHAQKVSAEVLELEEVKSDKEKQPYKINGGAKSEARLPAVYRAHHNARILCVMEHPTLKMRQNASLLLDVQYTPSFAISRTPGFGYPLREGIEVSLKCDVDSNPPSTPRWQKDDGDTPVPQTGDGYLNFSSIRREHSGWYKCTSRHLNFQYSSIGYYLSVRYDSVDVTSEPDDQDISVAAASHNPNKGQLEVQLGGAVTLQCPQGSLGCWSHLDPVTARLRGLGHGLFTPTGQFSLKDVVYQDAGSYKCIGQSPTNKKKLEVLQTVGIAVKGAPTVTARNATPVAYPGSPLHLAVEFCANPPAHAARWLHGDRVFTPGNQYGSTVLAYAVTDLPTPYCKEARLTYVSMHERVPRTFYFIVSSPGGVAEAVFKVNFTMRYRTMTNTLDDEEEELSEPEEIHFPVFGSRASINGPWLLPWIRWLLLLLLLSQPWMRRV